MLNEPIRFEEIVIFIIIIIIIIVSKTVSIIVTVTSIISIIIILKKANYSITTFIVVIYFPDNHSRNHIYSCSCINNHNNDHNRNLIPFVAVFELLLLGGFFRTSTPLIMPFIGTERQFKHRLQR